MENLFEQITNFVNSYNEIFNALLGFVIFLILFCFRKKLSSLILNIFSKLFFKKSVDKQKSIKESMLAPLSAFFTALGIYIAFIINFNNFTLINRAFKITCILIICWAIVNYLSNNLFLYLHFGKNADDKMNTTAIKFISNILKIIIIAFAVVMVISELGYNINGLLTGIGVGGLAVSLAAQDMVSNLISGFIIIFDKPFIVGELIQTSTIQGFVEEVTMRSTKIRTLEDSIVTVPNSTLTNDAIINLSRMDKRLINFDFGITYSTDNKSIEKCQNDIKQYLIDDEMILPDPIRVNLTKLNDSDLTISVTCYTTTSDVNEYYNVLNTVNLNIKRIVEGNNINFAFPSQSVYIEK